ncbi:hypothetical protein SUGI_0352640 [Cryptomeria japonica]|nr:hypothetical protein SUGI_0352640 [Cryptomeria japonica]
MVRLPGVEPGSIAWKAIILTVGLQTLFIKGLLLTTHRSQDRNRWTTNAVHETFIAHNPQLPESKPGSHTKLVLAEASFADSISLCTDCWILDVSRL